MSPLGRLRVVCQVPQIPLSVIADASPTAKLVAIRAEIAAAAKEAQKSGSILDGHIPPLATMFEDVYRDMPAHLQEQMRQAAAEYQCGAGASGTQPAPAPAAQEG